MTTGLKVLATIATAAVLGAGGIASANAGRAPTVERIDFSKVTPHPASVYVARLTPASEAPVKEFIIPIEDDTIRIAKDVRYLGWTFGGTVPGPTLHVRQGDQVKVTVVNKTNMPHSIDFHAARIPPNVAYRMILPGQTISFEFTARDPGAFLVHCGTPPVTMHLMQGMYLPMIVDPRGGWGTTADDEFVLVQSEFYADRDTAAQIDVPDFDAAMDRRPTYVAFNGRAFQYRDAPLQVHAGDRVRFFVVNAGPNLPSDFHVVGSVFDRVYPDGDPDHALHDVQTAVVPPGGGAVFETVFPRRDGIYPFVTHAFADADRGAVGMIRVGDPKQFATMSH